MEQNTNSVPPVPIDKNDICRWLYRLNWHIKDLRKARLKLDGEEEKEALAEEVRRLNALKTDVLCKLIAEGKAKFEEIHYIKNVKYCCIKLQRNFSFHVPKVKQIMKAVEEYEQSKMGRNTAAKNAQSNPD